MSRNSLWFLSHTGIGPNAISKLDHGGEVIRIMLSEMIS